MKALVFISCLLSFNLVNAQSPTINATVERALTLNTNFVLPVVRFNVYEEQFQTNSLGNLSLFNSIGAGVSINFGEILTIEENGSKNTKLEEKFANIAGLQIGTIFSADIKDGDESLSFGLTSSLLVLDFQIGVGYEFGEILPGETRGFVIVGYGVPLQKLTRANALKIKRWGIPKGKKSLLL